MEEKALTKQSSDSDFLTPEQIVGRLDKFIIGQADAKKAVAIAIRNRWRRQRVETAIRDEIYPNNIILIGPTGVGKTEIARRLAHIARAPFLKVEASRFTEVGYVGRDVESMVRDLVEISVNMVKQEKMKKVSEKAKQFAEERILDILLPAPVKPDRAAKETEPVEAIDTTREKIRAMLLQGKFDDRFVEIETAKQTLPFIEIFSQSGVEDLSVAIEEALGSRIPKKKKKRKLPLKEAFRYIENEETEKLVDMEEVIGEARRRAENSGIVFIDEIDKVAGSGVTAGPDVSREGVQRDLLPIVEGSNVMTKYGMIRTNHVLFIAAGAFHNKKPSDLIPELQGRFPIRVELAALSRDDFKRILIEPENSLIKQYMALLSTEGIRLAFGDDAIEEIASIAAKVNDSTENIGARRLHTIMTKLLEELLFSAPQATVREVNIDKAYVNGRLASIVKDIDLSRYIL